ncbi:dipeptidyl aminopeptidase/acylaminoacyl peptidase [Alkalihalobacillus xiaoxiensis]|uniref:Dipeptidyl aminopeptidase/acylaminoacyl peptidase n=1 Tax=Shouchella xiaoxiensis TaxID=766895 RepID=A0ABS2SSA1_9BACI|nr:prolyl oligopeptidase family serine peptidase [Shouchella xiaoxiensis]MBM7838383.1 dipeptidyl aminopeptidase/acylaminoacyl peptidase [Shouchella xiaoxiensis]
MIIKKVRVPSPHPGIYLFEVTYLSDGLKVIGLMAEPTCSDSLPGLLYLRGGIKSVGMVRVQRIVQWAHEGFIVFAPYYRGNRGGEGREDFCGDDREDAYQAFDLLEQHPKLSVEAGIHVVGFSRGGIMALWTGIKRPQTKTVTSWNGVTDMVLTYEERIDLRKMMKRVIGGTPWKYPERYADRTPLAHLDSFKPQLLIIHGEKDKHVSVEHVHQLVESLPSSNQAHTWIFPEFSHHFPPAEQAWTLSRAAQWMKEKSNP